MSSSSLTLLLIILVNEDWKEHKYKDKKDEEKPVCRGPPPRGRGVFLNASRAQLVTLERFFFLRTGRETTGKLFLFVLALRVHPTAGDASVHPASHTALPPHEGLLPTHDFAAVGGDSHHTHMYVVPGSPGFEVIKKPGVMPGHTRGRGGGRGYAARSGRGVNWTTSGFTFPNSVHHHLVSLRFLSSNRLIEEKRSATTILSRGVLG